jgi:hypothetical protein
MIRTSLLTAACTVLFLSSGAFFAPGGAASNFSFMNACSERSQSMKQTGSAPVGMKWTDFQRTCNSGHAPQASTAVQTPTPAFTPVSTKAAKSVQAPASKSAAAPDQASAGQSFMQACSAQWARMKSAGRVPAGMKWKAFLKTCNPASGSVVGSTPAVARAAPSTSSNRGNAVQPLPDQLAEQTRIKECGGEWKAAKAANTTPAGQTWPQFWSACNARLKVGHA